MRLAIIATTLVALAGSGPVLGDAQRAATAPDGAAVFTTYCASCHGLHAQGDGPVGESLRVPPANLTQLARKNGGVFPAETTRRTIDGRAGIKPHGSFEMPVWGDAFKRREGLSEDAVRERINALVRFLESIQERAGN